jgi:hypothetical protein
MPDYRRHRVLGGCYCFTVDLLERRSNTLLTERIDLLRQAEAEACITRPVYRPPSLLTTAARIAQVRRRSVPAVISGRHRSAKPTGVECFCLPRKPTDLHLS